jgi:TorA maturation chaperone TorD
MAVRCPNSPMMPDVDETDLARAQEYTLLSTLLLRSPDAQLLQRLQRLSGDESPLGVAHRALAKSAARIDADSVSREYFALFIGLGRGELLPYASYYLTGFVHGRPLAKLRQDLQRLGIERADGHSEPEDHVGILLEIMAGLASGGIPGPVGADLSFFQGHLSPWIGAFFSDLERARSAQFYAAVGKLGTTFLQIERQGFELPHGA